MITRRLPPRRVIALVAPVCTVGLALAGAAAVTFATDSHSPATIAGVLALLAASMIADRFPVPLDGTDSGRVSLAFAFGVSAIVLFGWAAGALVVFAAPAVVQFLEHRPLMRVAYNASVFAIAAAAAGWLIAPIGSDSVASLTAAVAVCAGAQYVVNMLLITAAVARTSRGPARFVSLMRSNVRWTAIPFSLMASAALVLVVVWQRAPVLTAALVGPLLAIALYQRSTYRALRAMRLALTDPLTGLGNHRHFHERLAKELADADKWRLSLSLCLVDIDNFKRINDRFGHPAGDHVLAQLASKLRSGGEAFRLGGDEFALLLPGFDERAALATARSIVERIEGTEIDPAGHVTVSAGVATFPIHSADRDELIRLADSALYWAKEYGKNQSRAYRPDVIELAELKRIARGPDRAARLRAAASLARAVDVRDAYTGRHSERVARLAASVATRMGLPADEVELTRLAGSLHDLGKLAIPEEILRKPGPLSEPERMVLERHPQIGFRMLESLGIDPVSAWVLHHHERWDGTGYPDGLPGDAIPLGARIIFVADAFDAMTSERVYRDRLDPDEALAELTRCAGTQFDPGVVAAFAQELGLAAEPEVLALALTVAS